VNYFQAFEMKRIVIYSHRCAPSNKFYRKFGVKELRQDRQTAAGAEILVDVFAIDIECFITGLSETLTRYMN